MGWVDAWRVSPSTVFTLAFEKIEAGRAFAAVPGQQKRVRNRVWYARRSWLSVARLLAEMSPPEGLITQPTAPPLDLAAGLTRDKDHPSNADDAPPSRANLVQACLGPVQPSAQEGRAGGINDFRAGDGIASPGAGACSGVGHRGGGSNRAVFAPKGGLLCSSRGGDNLVALSHADGESGVAPNAMGAGAAGLTDMTGTNTILLKAFARLVTQQASEEVILDVLVAEASLLLPSLCRDDLELIVIGVLESARSIVVAEVADNVVAFPAGQVPSADPGRFSFR